MKGDGEQTRNVTAVSLRETLLGLQSVDKLRQRQRVNVTYRSRCLLSPDLRPGNRRHLQAKLSRGLGPGEVPPPTPSLLTHPAEEESVVEQVVELLEALFHRRPSGLRQVQLSTQQRCLLAGEEDSLCICPVVKQGESWSSNITAQVHHLRHQVYKKEREKKKW